MPTITLKSKYAINTDLLLSVEELKSVYLFGIPVKDRGGVPIPDSTFEFNIKAATEQMQSYLSLLFKKQVYQETLPFIAENYWTWGYLRCAYPVVYPLLLEGFLNTTRQSTYPKEWLASRKTSDGILYHRNLWIIPAGNSTGLTQAQLFTGLIPNLTFMGLQKIPEYFTATYVTGFDKVPMPIVDAIGKLAAINIFRISGDLIIAPGISSMSIGIDGLSQSQSAKAYDNRISAMLTDLNQRILPELKRYYEGFLFAVC